ncbi:MAG: MBL fold metallo-hydrolase [Chloroflexi bacterium]|nr:MBL fold metallo-hydrolase [Chloroflexota bacterium]
MEIRILGAHNLESSETRLTSLLVDNSLVLDAGGLTSSLSLPAQEKLSAILLTHHHFDHVRDVATFGLATAFIGTTPLYATAPVLEMLTTHLINGRLYPNFSQWPPEKPALELRAVEPLKPFQLHGYTILPAPVSHAVPTVGYLVSRGGKSFFYTGDTGPGLASCWEHISPQLLITEMSGPNRLAQRMAAAQHFTPASLRDELVQFQKLKGYLPRVVLVHLPIRDHEELAAEVKAVAEDLNASITLAKEGMRLRV